jgi:hypothetical protein
VTPGSDPIGRGFGFVAAGNTRDIETTIEREETCDLPAAEIPSFGKYAETPLFIGCAPLFKQVRVCIN